jgi:DNA (cytosine-5)-methyltransferase 1
MKNGKLQIATVFSGIGAFEQSLNKLHIPYDIVFACDNGEREIKEEYEDIMKYSNEHKFGDVELNNYVKELYKQTHKENHMKTSYFANYDISEDRWYEDIRFINGKKYEGQVDIFVGGSPCQSFSNMGKRKGLEDARGTLFYNYAKLISDMKPKVFIYENVPGMLNHNGKDTWNRIAAIFDSLGYAWKKEILNGKDFGIPQNRNRLFVVGFRKPFDKKFEFPNSIELKTTMFDYLESKPEARHYLGKKGFEFVTNPKYRGRAVINNEIIRTQKANQQFNWNGDFVFEEFDKIKDRPDVLNRAYVGTWNGKKGVVRQLTYRECYRLMGFNDSYDFSKVNNLWRYRQAGNSIIVNVLEAIMKEILKVEDFNE